MTSATFSRVGCLTRNISGQKKHDSQRRDRVLRFFLRPEIGQFSPHLGLLRYTENRRKRNKIHWRKFQNIQWRRRPEIADFCPLSLSNTSSSIKSRSPPPGKSVNFEDFLLICTVFPHLGPFRGGGGVKPNFADKKFMDTQTFLNISLLFTP